MSNKKFTKVYQVGMNVHLIGKAEELFVTFCVRDMFTMTEK